MKKSLLQLVLTFVFAVLTTAVYGQATTTASLSGEVVDKDGTTVPGATIVAIHTPSGTRYGSITNADGKYRFPGMRVGGPYTVTASFVGFETAEQTNLFLQLGQNATLDFVLAETSIQLESVEVRASRNSVLNSDRTGASTNITTEQLENLPTISRSLTDFTRLTPQANGNSLGGANNRFNNFSIDGIVNNDVFGLAGTGTNGGQIGVNPVSLDAIEQIQVSIAPFDLRQGGFTGGQINAITRSGTNEYVASAYYFTQNESFVGKSPDEDRTDFAEFTSRQYGARVGGPIIKDKLFFFANLELTTNDTPVGNIPGTAQSNWTVAELQPVFDKLVSLGYDPGAFVNQTNNRESTSFLTRLDWNISDKHKMTLRYNLVDGESTSIGRSASRVRFGNNGQFFPSTTNSLVMELNSIFNNQLSNELRVGFTSVRDDRDPAGDPFPYIRIDETNGRRIEAGSERFSVANQLDQDIFTITNNVTLYKSDHTFTFGTNLEFYSFTNLFIRENFGNYRYSSIADFLTIGTANEVTPRSYDVSYVADDPTTQRPVSFNSSQIGFYIQDEWTGIENLKLTFGLRADIPIFNETPTRNAAVEAAFPGFATNKMPDTRVLWSPRVGFNWDVKGDKTTQVRGGAGIFSGRAPFVWISNAFGNSGVEYARFTLGGFGNPAVPGDFSFRADPFGQYVASDLGLSERTSEINLVSNNFRFPQVFRANVAVDQQLPWGIIGTAEFLYTKTINNVDFFDINQAAPTSNLDNGNGNDDRPRWGARVNDDFTNVILLRNSSEGYTYNITGQLQRPFENGFTASFAYTFGRATSFNDGTSSQAVSNWRFNESTQGINRLDVTTSDFDLGSRIVASASYEKEWARIFKTTISVFYNGQSGSPFSYVYNNDINGDNFGTDNDLIYVPRSLEEANLVDIVSNGTVIATAAEQWAELNAYIEDDSYLSGRRGQYAERNGARTPWTNRIDVRLLQDIKIQGENRLQLSLDILNFANFLDGDAGRVYTTNFGAFPLMQVEGVTNGVPEITSALGGLNNVDGQRTPYDVADFASRWRMQFGIRYLLN